MRWSRVSAPLVLAGALFALASQASSAILITVDKATQQMTVVVDGELRWTWPVSTGLTKYDTPTGSYTTFRMERKHFSREWDDAPMPHSIFFTQNGHAIHGSYAIRRLGNPASHGCVRLAPKNAAQLFALVRKHGLANTQVVVQGTLPGSDPMPIIAVPLPRERSAALRMVAALEAPAAVQDDASTFAESKHGAAAIAAVKLDKPSEELTASARIRPQSDERRNVLPAATEADTAAVIPRDRSITLESKPDTAAITVLKPEPPAEGQTAAVRIVAQPSELNGEVRALVEPAMPVAPSDTPTVADADPGATAVAAHSPEVPVVEQREATRTVDDPRRRQAAHALPRPRVPPEPPMQRQSKREPAPHRAERNRPPRYADRIYDEPPVYRRLWSTGRPPIIQRRSPRFAPDNYFDPHVEIIEEVYVNGQWVRHRYYRRARPSDFYRYR